MKATLLACLILSMVLVHVSVALDPFSTQVWTFPTGRTTIEITLTQNIGHGPYAGFTTLMASSPLPANFTLAEEATCIRSVIDDAPHRGIDPKMIYSIYLPELHESDVKVNLVKAAAHSQRFQRAVKRHQNVEVIVEDMLNSMDAYAEINRVFAPLGKRFKVGATEEVWVGPIGELRKPGEMHLEGIPSDLSSRIRVPVIATVYLSLVR